MELLIGLFIVGAAITALLWGCGRILLNRGKGHPMRICPECHGSIPVGVAGCPQCGA